MLMTIASFAQGVTTSAITGEVTDETGMPLPGANLVAVHEPTGTNYATITDLDGNFRISNMRIGGPYSITVTYVGKETINLDNISLQLGNTEKFEFLMKDSSNELDEVVISASKSDVFDSGKTGTETNISLREIQSLPTATRDIADFIRKTPQAQVGEDGSISLAGQNNRYNSIFVDGAVNNDVFGLAASGTNGGQIGVSPLSIDAIESFQINLAPFDVRQSGFTGGAINAITRSGSNDFDGSAYYYYRNEDLAGKTPVGINEDDRQKLNEFSAKTYGVRLGGPIIENKLFFFVNYERQEEETPQPFDPSTYQGNSSLSDIQNLRQSLLDNFGYDAGDFTNNTRSLISDKFTVRLDWNIDDKNAIIAKHNYVKGESTSPNSSSQRNINFFNAGIFFPSETNSSTLEWNTTNGSNLSNNLRLGYTSVNDDRDPLGNPFPRVSIEDGSGSITFGSEAFSTANLLEQKIFTVTNNFEIFTGNHNITIGGNFEYYDMLNVFVRQNYGAYEYLSLSDFNSNLDNDPTNDVGADTYFYSYSLLDPAGTFGDEITNAAAKFEFSQLALYAQDAWDITNDFKLTYGVRFDLPFYQEGTVNDDFNDRTIPLLEDAGKDLEGARVGQAIESKLHFSPRIGFNWDAKGDRTIQVRGGLGVFTSRIPLVWPGGAYNNNGIAIGNNNFGNTEFFADPFGQPANPNALPGSGTLGGDIDLFTPDFKLPQVAKYNIGADFKTGIWDLIVTADFLYNDVINQVYYQNLNVKNPTLFLNGADNRPFYNRSDEIDDTYGRIILGTNTSEGYSYNSTLTVTKPFTNGFAGQVSYTYGDGKYIFEGTSSQNSSQWRNINTVNGKNSNLRATNSQFATGSRITASGTYEFEWLKNFKTTFGLFYNGQSGQRISYIYNDTRDLLNDDSTDGALIYIPRNQSEINLVPVRDNSGNVVLTADEQWQALDAYISNDDYLSERRGGYAENNGSRTSWNHLFDLKVLQDFYIESAKGKRNTLQLSFDIFNVANFLNKNWGEQTFVPNFGNVELIETVRNGENPEFNFDPRFNDGIEEIDDSGIRSSRWQMQIGLRYSFN